MLPDSIKESAYDIRLNAGQPVSIRAKQGIFYLKGQGLPTRNWQEAKIYCSAPQLQALLLQLCAHSLFSHENEIKNGFVMVENSCRVGICGTAVLEAGTIKNIRDISSMVFRIPREKKGCCAPLFHKHIDVTGGVLLVGEPSSGKTTVLRDLVQSLSSGIFSGPMRVAVVDERSEISGCYDLGPCTDVLKGYPKQAGIEMAIRSLSPELLVCDELSHQELEAVTKALYSGVPLIASVHGNEKNLLQKAAVRAMLEQHMFETIVFLSGRGSPGNFKMMYKAGELLETVGGGADYHQQSRAGAAAGPAAEKKRIHVA